MGCLHRAAPAAAALTRSAEPEGAGALGRDRARGMAGGLGQSADALGMAVVGGRVG